MTLSTVAPTEIGSSYLYNTYSYMATSTHGNYKNTWVLQNYPGYQFNSTKTFEWEFVYDPYGDSDVIVSDGYHFYSYPDSPYNLRNALVFATPVPEPSSGVMVLGSGLVLLLYRRKFRSSRLNLL